MITLSNASIIFYELLNDVQILDLLNGGSIYREQRPVNSQNNDIVIKTRFMKSEKKTGVAVGEIQIVLILNKISNYIDTQKINAIEKNIIEILKSKKSENKQKNYTTYFELKNTTFYPNYNGQELFSSLYLTYEIYK